MGIELNAIGIECFARARPLNNWRSSDGGISSICGNYGQETSKKEKSFFSPRGQSCVTTSDS
jgi:hypothetical protein